MRDAALRRELRKLVRDKPQSTLIEVRDEDLMWSLEDLKLRASKVALNPLGSEDFWSPEKF